MAKTPLWIEIIYYMAIALNIGCAIWNMRQSFKSIKALKEVNGIWDDIEIKGQCQIEVQRINGKRNVILQWVENNKHVH